MSRLVLGLSMLASAFSCTNDIKSAAHLTEPTTVFLIDHGRHASLAIADEGGGLMHYAYGDWRWYALSDESLSVGLSALFGDDAAFGQKHLPVPATATAVKAAMVEGAEMVLPVSVEAAKVRLLRQRLAGLFAQHRTTMVTNDAYNLDFVRIEDGYSLTHNSNVQVAEWLEELGCEVSGVRFISSWRVYSP